MDTSYFTKRQFRKKNLLLLFFFHILYIVQIKSINMDTLRKGSLGKKNFYYYFSFIYCTLKKHGTVGSHHEHNLICFLFVELVLYESHHIVVMRLGQAGFHHGTDGLKVTVSSGNLWPFSPTGA
jgi:hypothetical protein